MPRKILYTVLLKFCFLFFPFYLSAQCAQLIWSDEFDGESLDTNYWNYQTGDGCDLGICGWGNNELQSYQKGNVSVSDGTLKIVAKREQAGGKSYTSGRINTDKRVQATYGRFEASIKLPEGGGLWPAFWMLPNDYVYGRWPQSGEIDIMEFVGNEPEKVSGAIHYGNLWPNNQFQTENYYLNSGFFFEDFHTFVVEWEPNRIRWLVDDVLFMERTNTDVTPFRWPFDQDFHILLNVAVGGALGGQVDNRIFPATMEVDYVRIYDNYQPFLQGERRVLNAAEEVVYQLGNVDESMVIQWTVPEGATITDGQGTPAITVDWGDVGGDLAVEVMTPCDTFSLSMNVFVEAPYQRSFSFENFDEEGTVSLGSFSGSLFEVENPAPDAVNSSNLVGKYTRSSSNQFDALFYVPSQLEDADEYVEGTRQFVMDIFTNAPIGTEILLQLETSNASPTNYPVGRHSRYQATVQRNDGWHRLVFKLLDQPDQNAPGTQIENIVVLFAPNTNTGDIYYYDNFDSYSQAVNNPTSTFDFKSLNGHVKVLPNPVRSVSQVQFELPQAASVQYRIISTTGQIIQQSEVQDLPKGRHSLNLDLFKFRRGIYLVQLLVDGSVIAPVKVTKM